jgi:Tol biopolymer transport system component
MHAHVGPRGRRRGARAALALAFVGLFAALAAVFAFPAHAKLPGLNGMIVFTRTDFNAQTDNTYIVNPDGSHLQALLPGIHTSGAHWSPDGSKLALLDEDTPCPPCSASTIILNPDTGKYRVLAPPALPDTSFGCSLWSPDASRFACAGESDNNPSVNGVYTIRTKDGGGLTRITDAGGGGLMDIPIDYSPDGKQLVFGRVSFQDHSCINGSGLFVVNVDGSGLHRITPNGFCDDDGSWSPDGSEIAFASGPCCAPSNIWIVHPNGTGLMQLPIKAPRGGFGDISWSPDGSKLAFIFGGPSTPEGIFTANADGTDLQPVTNSPVFDHEADWGPHPISP